METQRGWLLRKVRLKCRCYIVICVFLVVIMLYMLDDYVDFKGVEYIKLPDYGDLENEGKGETTFRNMVLLPRHLKRFSSYIMSERERLVLVETLRLFDAIWRRHLGKPYLLMFGSLLGIIRHGGIVPFDDDIDLAIRKSDYDQIYKLLNNTGLTVKGRSDTLARVYLSNQSLTIPVKGAVHRWPFMDVFFYEIRDGKFFHSDGNYSSEIIEDYLPPVMLPFEGHMFPTTRCPWKHWKKEYKYRCLVRAYRHKTCKSDAKDNYVTSCADFRKAFPFASWERVNSTHVHRIISSPEVTSSGKRIVKTTRTELYLPQCSQTHRIVSFFMQAFHGT